MHMMSNAGLLLEELHTKCQAKMINGNGSIGSQCVREGLRLVRRSQAPRDGTFCQQTM